jgi:hypothetical protein
LDAGERQHGSLVLIPLPAACSGDQQVGPSRSGSASPPRWRWRVPSGRASRRWNPSQWTCTSHEPRGPGPLSLAAAARPVPPGLRWQAAGPLAAGQGGPRSSPEPGARAPRSRGGHPSGPLALKVASASGSSSSSWTPGHGRWSGAGPPTRARVPRQAS